MTGDNRGMPDVKPMETGNALELRLVSDMTTSMAGVFLMFVYDGCAEVMPQASYGYEPNFHGLSECVAIPPVKSGREPKANQHSNPRRQQNPFKNR